MLIEQLNGDFPRKVEEASPDTGPRDRFSPTFSPPAVTVKDRSIKMVTFSDMDVFSLYITFKVIFIKFLPV
jgi:hypothetical protein